MIKLALQIPTKYLKAFSIFTDFDFALAHKVLEDKEYAEFYRKQSASGRQVWLDNSMLELGEPLSEQDIIRAASYIKATHLIAPDKFDQSSWSVNQAINFKLRYGAFYNIIGCCHGTPKEQQEALKIYQHRNIIPTLSYREDRSWYTADKWGPVHFLGFGNLQNILDAKPTSIDTDFPIRLGMIGMPLTTTDRNDKTPLPPVDFNTLLTQDQLKMAVWNCWRLKVMLWT